MKYDFNKKLDKELRESLNLSKQREKEGYWWTYERPVEYSPTNPYPHTFNGRICYPQINIDPPRTDGFFNLGDPIAEALSSGEMYAHRSIRAVEVCIERDKQGYFIQIPSYFITSFEKRQRCSPSYMGVYRVPLISSICRRVPLSSKDERLEEKLRQSVQLPDIRAASRYSCRHTRGLFPLCSFGTGRNSV